MAFARSNRTINIPRRAKSRPRRPVMVSGPASGTSAFVQEAGTWNFAARVWIAFDPPTAAAPNWIPISGYVETNRPISIGPHGRPDGLADVPATRMTLTLDNSDGRFSTANPSGPWYGRLHKGNWIKVEILPPSGIVSQRFVGFITDLPTGWQGQYATCQISATDRYEKLGVAPALVSSIQSEVLTDPNLIGNVKGYWNLHEATGSLTFGDTSGNGASHLAAQAFGGVQVGTGLGASNVPGPGFDGLRAVTFNPPSSSQGTYLSAAITSPVGVWNYGTPAYTGLFPTVEFWVQATTTGVDQPLVCLVDPTSQSAVTVYISGTTGALNMVVLPTIYGATFGARGGLIAQHSVTDGNWHHVIFAESYSSNGGNFYYNDTSIVDGGQRYLSSLSSSGGAVGIPGNYGSAYAQLIVGGGWMFPAGQVGFSVGAANISDVAFYWGDTRAGGAIANVVDHYGAGKTGNAGESTDQRVARVARYAGVPIPLQTISAQVWNNSSTKFTTQVYSPSKGGWTNLSPGSHSVGTQSVSGRGALDVMREAARTEGMPLYVDRAGYLALQPSTIRQNTLPAWTVSALDLEAGTEMPDNFAYVTNVATITPNGQAAQTVVGPLGAASQAKYGIYTNGGSQATASQNPIEAQSLGYSLIQLRADPPARLAPIVVEAATLATQPGYGPAWYDAVLATDVSTPMRVTDLPVQIGGGTSDVLVEGWSEVIVAGTHTFSFSSSSVQGPTYQLDDTVLGRLDTAGSTLVSGIGTATTTFQVSTTGSGSGAPTWTTNPSDFPFDILVGAEQMTVTGIANLLASDGTFEGSVAAWTSAGGSGSSSSAQAHSGTQSVLLTVVGTPASMTLRSSNATVFPGLTYSVTHWMLASVGTPNVQVTIDWYTSGAVFISSSTSSSVAASAAWTTQTVTALAPPTAGLVRVGATMPGSPATGNAIYVDDVSLSPSALSQLFTVVRSVNGVVSSPAAGTAVNVATPLTLAY